MSQSGIFPTCSLCPQFDETTWESLDAINYGPGQLYGNRLPAAVYQGRGEMEDGGEKKE